MAKRMLKAETEKEKKAQDSIVNRSVPTVRESKSSLDSVLEDANDENPDGTTFMWFGGIPVDPKKRPKFGQAMLTIFATQKEQIEPGEVFDVDELILNHGMSVGDLRKFLRSEVITNGQVLPVSDKAKEMLRAENARYNKIMGRVGK